MNTPIIQAPRSERLNLRISPDALQKIRSAAAAQQQDVTSFVLGAALDSARDVLLREQIMYLSREGMKQIEEALDAEPQAVPELVDAIRKSRQQFGRVQSASHSVHQ